MKIRPWVSTGTLMNGLCVCMCQLLVLRWSSGRPTGCVPAGQWLLVQGRCAAWGSPRSRLPSRTSALWPGLLRTDPDWKHHPRFVRPHTLSCFPSKQSFNPLWHSSLHLQGWNITSGSSRQTTWIRRMTSTLSCSMASECVNTRTV